MNHPVVLHVEDDDNDAFFVRRAFAKANLDCDLRWVADGQKALDYLGGGGMPAGAETNPTPALVLLDLKLPVLTGFEVLQWIRSQPRYEQLPVAILSGSSLDEDRRQALVLGANEYFVKGGLFAELIRYVAGVLSRQPPPPALVSAGKTAP